MMGTIIFAAAFIWALFFLSPLLIFAAMLAVPLFVIAGVIAFPLPMQIFGACLVAFLVLAYAAAWAQIGVESLWRRWRQQTPGSPR